MAGISLLLLSGNATLAGQDRAGALTATGVGALRYATGKIDGTQAFFIEEATTNLVGNPWFGNDATGWTGATRTTAYAYQGVASGLISATAANAQATYALTVPATSHRLSAVVRNNAAASRSVQLLYNGVLVGSAVTVLAGAVVRLDAAITGTATSVGAGVRIITSANGETFNVGHLQIEAKGYRTSETPALDAAGTILAGYTWTGTAHASSSTRSATTVTVDEVSRILPAQGSAAVWVYRDSLK
ncbi:MAG: hypothetical protein M3440_00765, partial [Chloroflexota bacterium]|nr:hypothetical protein [Chloroflexota bacterium]